MTRAGDRLYAELDAPDPPLWTVLAHPDFFRGFRHVMAVIVVWVGMCW